MVDSARMSRSTGYPAQAADVVAVGGDERIALALGEAEPGGLEGGDQVDLARAGTDVVPVRQHDPVPVAEQVSPPGVAVDHPFRQAEAELVVGVQQPLASLASQAALIVGDGLAVVDRLADRDQRLVGGQRDGRWPEAMQPAQQMPQIRRTRRRATLRQITPERDRAPVG